MKHRWLIPLAVLVAGGTAAACFWFLRGAPHQVPVQPAEFQDNQPESGPADACSPESAKAPALNRLEALRQHADGAGARSTDSEFISAMSDTDPDIRSLGFELALSLGKREGPKAECEVVRIAIFRDARDLRRKGLIAARDVKDPSLVSDLLDYKVENSGEYELVLDALARSGDPRASDRLCDIAEDHETNRSLRTRALALLSQFSTQRSFEVLVDAMRSEDQEIARVAKAAYEIANKRR